MNKTFCIGLHKQGTSSLADFADINGLKSIHSTNWQNQPSLLNEYDFFSDGGSHYDGINEFEFENLSTLFENSKFILQTRDPEKWIISKLVHAGWNLKTTFSEGDTTQQPEHSGWKEKTLLNIKRFLTHKKNYEAKVKKYFESSEGLSNRLLTIDVTAGSNESNSLVLARFLGINDANYKPIPWSNKVASKGSAIKLPMEVHEYISKLICDLF